MQHGWPYLFHFKNIIKKYFYTQKSQPLRVNCNQDRLNSYFANKRIFVNVFIFIMLSTIFEHQIYLGFLSQQPLQQKTFEKTFLGGRPIFLRRPDAQLLECTICNKQKLTFICQIFCPLDAPESYNRVLYVFYCEKCERVFRCIKQQTQKTHQIQQIETNIRVISEISYEIQSNEFEVKELMKIMKRAQIEVEDQVIEQKEQEGYEDDQEQEIKQIDLQTINKMGFNQYQSNQLSKQQMQSLKYASQVKQQAKQQKDTVFEQYKKVMNQIDSPVLLYSNIPIPYNNQTVNPKHFCKFCKTKLSLQLQLTERLLSLNLKLLRLDWGSLMIFTCGNSCNESIEECIVVQYEIDAIQDSQVETLRKRQKNKKRKQQKQKSRSRQRQHKSKSKQGQKPQKQQGKSEQNDWD